MAASSTISCCLGPPAPPKEGATRRLQPTPPATLSPWSGGLCRACVAAAACAVLAMSDGGGDMVLSLDTAAARAGGGGGVAATAVQAPAPPRWSDRRQCPPWRANSLENIVPENLPRPSVRRRFNGVTAAESAPAPALAPEAVAPFLALHSGMGCFSL